MLTAPRTASGTPERTTMSARAKNRPPLCHATVRLPNSEAMSDGEIHDDVVGNRRVVSREARNGERGGACERYGGSAAAQGAFIEASVWARDGARLDASGVPEYGRARAEGYSLWHRPDLDFRRYRRKLCLRRGGRRRALFDLLHKNRRRGRLWDADLVAAPD